VTVLFFIAFVDSSNQYNDWKKKGGEIKIGECREKKTKDNIYEL